ncbi:resistin-like gamma [Discoglossus pictus]
MTSLPIFFFFILIASTNAQAWWGWNNGYPVPPPKPKPPSHGGGGYPSGNNDGSSCVKCQVAELSCEDSKANGAYARCKRGFVVTGCACGMGCGSWNVENGNGCHCQCSNMDWTTARCCRNIRA